MPRKPKKALAEAPATPFQTGPAAVGRAITSTAQLPTMANHPIVSGVMPMFTPHRPARPEKSEGGIRFDLVSDFEPKGDQPTAIEELVAGVAPMSATRCCSASPARARPSPWRR